MNYWPTELPEPMTGNSFTTSESRLESEGSIAPRQRIIDPNYRKLLSLSWNMTEHQYRLFESWHHHVIHDGVSRFQVNWSGQHGRARFTSPVQAQLAGSHWEVTGEAEIDYALS